MWVNVNDFYHALRGKQRHASSNTDNTQFKMNARNDLVHYDMFIYIFFNLKRVNI